MHVVLGLKNGQVYFGEVVYPGEMKGPAVHLFMEELTRGTLALRLRHAQQIMYMSPSTKGWFALATEGPSDGCQVTRPVSEALVTEIRDILVCNDLAAQRWKTCPWGKIPQPMMVAPGGLAS